MFIALTNFILDIFQLGGTLYGGGEGVMGLFMVVSGHTRIRFLLNCDMKTQEPQLCLSSGRVGNSPMKVACWANNANLVGVVPMAIFFTLELIR
jgi:hypothetical protein